MLFVSIKVIDPSSLIAQTEFHCNSWISVPRNIPDNVCISGQQRKLLHAAEEYGHRD